LVAGFGGIGVERLRLAPVEQRFLEGVKRAGELCEKGEDAPEEGEACGKGDAAFLVRMGRLRRRSWSWRGGNAKREVFHGGGVFYAKRLVRRQRVMWLS
jgi:hypothetical protein